MDTRRETGPAQVPSGEHMHDVTTIREALERTALRGDEVGIHLYDAAGVKHFMSYQQVLDGARRAAAFFMSEGITRGTRVVMVVPNSYEFVTVFMGATMCGVVPIPVAPPRSPMSASMSNYLASLQRLGSRMDSRHLVVHATTDESVLSVAGTTGSHFEWITPTSHFSRTMSDTEELAPGGDVTTPGDDAYIQCSSGSTGDAKGVRLSHRSLLANVRAIGEHLDVDENDVGVSWLPLYHDMGLVGVLIFSVYWGLPLVMLDPQRFLKMPHEWLWAVTNHQATLSPAPDFGFHYVARRAKRSELEGLDLSSWRVAICGSEPIQQAHLDAFQRRLSPYGLREHVIVPMYGLSEASLCVSSAPVGAPPKVDRVSREALQAHLRAQPSDDEDRTVELVSVGRPIPAIDMVIRDKAGEPVGPRELGEIFISGASVMSGYVDEDHSERPSGEERWVATGDLGYIADGDLYITGRVDDAIELAAGTLFPQELETLVADVDGVRPGSVAVFGVPLSAAARNRHRSIRDVADRAERDSGFVRPTDSELHEELAAGGPELLIVAVEASDGLDHESLRTDIFHTLHEQLKLVPHDVRVLSTHSIPKTSSGKVRRFLCKQLYLDEALDRRERQDRWQALTNLTERARSMVAQVGRRIRSYFDEAD